MGKADYKKVGNKESFVQDRLRHKGIFCISNEWLRWGKRYLNRANRRKKRGVDYQDI